MQHQEVVVQITEKLEVCKDADLLDLILKLFIESGY